MVDDEINLSQLVKLSLEQYGVYEVKTECLGERALEAARSFRPHLLLLDVCLLDTDGGRVASEILSDAELKHTPIVFITSLVSPQETQNGPVWNSGVPVLSKPFDSVKLIACIKRTLAGRSGGVTGPVLDKRVSDTRMIKKNLVQRIRALDSALTGSSN